MASAASRARMLSFVPIAGDTPVRIPADETWVAPAILDRAQAEARIRALVEPHLTHRDDAGVVLEQITAPLVWLPFWRVKLAVTGLRLVSSAKPPRIDIANISFPMPIPSVGGHAGVLMISARHAVPYAPRLPSFFGGTDALEVHKRDLLLRTNERAAAALDASEGEIVDADVDRATGERLAADALMLLLPKLRQRPRVESGMFVLHPFFFARFGSDEEHHVLLSARDGNAASAHYPRPPTLSERVRRFFTAS